jgi:hypothetical protein
VAVDDAKSRRHDVVTAERRLALDGNVTFDLREVTEFGIVSIVAAREALDRPLRGERHAESAVESQVSGRRARSDFGVAGGARGGQVGESRSAVAEKEELAPDPSLRARRDSKGETGGRPWVHRIFVAARDFPRLVPGESVHPESRRQSSRRSTREQ